MTQKRLKKYHYLTVRLKILMTTVVTDSVKASSADYSYTSHSVTLHGVQRDDKTLKEIDRMAMVIALNEVYGLAGDRLKRLEPVMGGNL